MKNWRLAWLSLALCLVVLGTAIGAPVFGIPEGFAGIAWGTAPGEVANIRLVRTEAADSLQLYEAPGLDAGVIIGDVKPSGDPLLVFSLKEGLIMGQVEVAGDRYGLVAAHLASRLGQPVMYELIKPLPAEYLSYDLWFTGNTRIELILLADRARVKVSRRGITAAGQ